MKLGEALVLRSQLRVRIQQLRTRLKASVVVQEGEKPPEDPQALLQELEALFDEWERLVAAINRTNIAARLPTGETLTDALARRDALTAKHEALRELADAASEQRHRYGRAEIRITTTVDVGGLRRRADELARERRDLDIRLQEANWAVDLQE